MAIYIHPSGCVAPALFVWECPGCREQFETEYAADQHIIAWKHAGYAPAVIARPRLTA